MRVLGERTINNIRIRYYGIGRLVIGVALNIGPRIMHLSLTGKEEDNMFGIIPDFGITTSEGLWRIYGGHRLWVSPEAMPRSYSLDDRPVEIVEENDRIEIIGNPELQNSIKKRIIIEKAGEQALKVKHIIENIGRWPIKFSCWAISVMSRGGYAIIPLWPHKVDEKGLLPDRKIVLWPYTDLDDERLHATRKHLILRHNPRMNKPIKIGASAYPYWAAYYNKGLLFMKSFRYYESEYPDYGVYVEVYANNLFLELETLGPLRDVEPGQENIHAEIWKLVKIGELKPTDEELERKVASIYDLTKS
ncbi:MAG: hypothetical protein ABWW65_05550 [Thermoprotei archaeon]